MKRSELDLKRKKIAKNKKLALQLAPVVLVAGILLGVMMRPSDPIDLLKHEHACNEINCTYQATVKNSDLSGHNSYLKINAFINVSKALTTSREMVASTRKVFEISAGEEKTIKGEFSVTTKPETLDFSVGEIEQSP